MFLKQKTIYFFKMEIIFWNSIDISVLEKYNDNVNNFQNSNEGGDSFEGQK